ncbi:MAG: c-type cytochrome, partial [Acidobacteria bacterium]|nr:c-type cytochrome [Acidobacteriota bacterium]
MKAQAVGIKRSVRSAIAVFALAIPALVLVGLAETSAPEQESILLSVELPDTPTAGARLFAQKACIRCHSLGGHETRVGPDLGRIVFSGTVLDLAGAFWNHSPVMREKMRDLKVQAPTMTSREMADLIAFLGAYRYYLSEVGQPGSPEAGRTV